jgi:CheY-like chemotaxis protein
LVQEVTLLKFGDLHQALEVVAGAEPDLFIADVLFPGINLLEMFPVLAEKGVKCPIVAMSGYFTEQEMRDRAGTNLNVSFVAKPFSPDELHRKCLVHLSPSEWFWKSKP